MLSEPMTRPTYMKPTEAFRKTASQSIARTCTAKDDFLRTKPLIEEELSTKLQKY